MAIAQQWRKFFNKPAPNLCLRLLVMLIGTAFVSFSVALSRTTGLGTSPISCVPAALSYLTPLTIGTWTFLMNLVFICGQALLLRKDFKILQLFQLPFLFVFSFLIDVFVPVAELIPMDSYPIRLLLIACGCCLTACGIVLQVKSSLIMLSADAFVVTISRVFHLDFSKCKIAFDCTLAGTACLIGLIGAGQLLGVREGTIIFALCTGLLMKVFHRIFRNFELVVPIQGHLTLLPEEKEEGAAKPDELPLVITISREYGSGGRTLGHAIGKLLDIKVYDRSLVNLVAEESGLTTNYVQSHEEEIRRGILYNLFTQNYEYIGARPAETDALFLAQARTITRLAQEESCVIIGRNANYILANRQHCFNIFIHAPLEVRVQRVMKRDGISAKEARDTIEKVDAERAEHARRFTGHSRGRVDDYHLCIDSSLASAEEIAKLVVALATH